MSYDEMCKDNVVSIPTVKLKDDYEVDIVVFYPHLILLHLCLYEIRYV